MWHRDWHGFPAWDAVLKTREVLSEAQAPQSSAAGGAAGGKAAAGTKQENGGGDAGGVWASLTNAERRMMCEVTALNAAMASNLQLTDLRKEGRAALHLKVLSAARSRRQQQQQQQQQQPAAAAAAREHATAAAEGSSSSSSSSRSAGGSNAYFVGAMSLSIFLFAHKLTDARDESCHFGLLHLSGCTAGLSMQRAAELIVAPALEAAGGVSYAEAFFSQVRLGGKGAWGTSFQNPKQANRVNPAPPERRGGVALTRGSWGGGGGEGWGPGTGGKNGRRRPGDES